MRLRIVLIVFPFVLALLVPAAASAGTLDQQQTNSNNVEAVAGPIWHAQVFTPALDGQLDEVDLLLQRIGTPAGDLTVQIWTVGGGGPSSQVPGASATVLMTNIPTGAPTWVQVPISAPSVAGTQYAILVADPAGSFGGCPDTTCLFWMEDDNNPYADPSYLSVNSGASWAPQARDYAFKTYVATASDQLSALLAEVDGLTPKSTRAKLEKTLNKLSAHIAADETNHACKDLETFIKQVHAAKKLTHDQRASLTTQAQNIEAALGC